jgi:hypothetical protein
MPIHARMMPPPRAQLPAAPYQVRGRLFALLPPCRELPVQAPARDGPGGRFVAAPRRPRQEKQRDLSQ